MENLYRYIISCKDSKVTICFIDNKSILVDSSIIFEVPYYVTPFSLIAWKENISNRLNLRFPEFVLDEYCEIIEKK